MDGSPKVTRYSTRKGRMVRCARCTRFIRPGMRYRQMAGSGPVHEQCDPYPESPTCPPRHDA